MALYRQYLEVRAVRLAILICYWLILFVATHLPDSVLHVPERGFDKVLHFSAFALLAALLAGAYRPAGGLSGGRAFGLWLIMALYAGGDEWTQTYFSRDADVRDFIADVVGAALALLFLVWLRGREKLRSDAHS